MKRLQMMLLICLIFLSPLCAGASDLGGMRFSFIRGDVQVWTEHTNDWVPASINMPLREGNRIWVPEEGPSTGAPVTSGGFTPLGAWPGFLLHLVRFTSAAVTTTPTVSTSPALR